MEEVHIELMLTLLQQEHHGKGNVREKSNGAIRPHGSLHKPTAYSTNN